MFFDTLMVYAGQVMLAVVVFGLLIKLILWLQLRGRNRNFNILFISFIHWFQDAEMHEIPEADLRRFMKGSNLINVFLWLTLLFYIAASIFTNFL